MLHLFNRGFSLHLSPIYTYIFFKKKIDALYKTNSISISWNEGIIVIKTHLYKFNLRNNASNLVDNFGVGHDKFTL